MQADDYVMAMRYPVSARSVSPSKPSGLSWSTMAMASARVALYPSTLFDPWIAWARALRCRNPVHRTELLFA